MGYPSKIVIHINEELDSKHRIKLSDQVQEKKMGLYQHLCMINELT